MKKLFLLLSFVLVCIFSQAQAYEARLESQRKQHVAAVIELPYPPDVVENGLKEYMAKLGYKLSSSKSINTFKGVKLHPNNVQNNDVHFNVERKSRKEKEASLLYMVVSKENESLSQRLADDRAGIEDAKSFLNGMVPHLEAYHLEYEITGQDDNVKKAEKKLENLVEDQRDLEKRIKGLQEKLQKNQKDQESQKSEIANQKNILENLKGKRKATN